jgi:hypothetical protein
VELQPLAADVEAQLCERLEHCFDKMLEAVDYRLDVLVDHEVRHFDLIPVAEYQTIRIFTSDVEEIERLLSGKGSKLAYVSFIGEHRPGVMEAVEATDRALIGASPADSPILGYFSLQDPNLAWINLVLFDSLETVGEWVKATSHADDWELAASYFTKIEKSIGYMQYRNGSTELQPMRLVMRDYELSGS